MNHKFAAVDSYTNSPSSTPQHSTAVGSHNDENDRSASPSDLEEF